MKNIFCMAILMVLLLVAERSTACAHHWAGEHGHFGEMHSFRSAHRPHGGPPMHGMHHSPGYGHSGPGPFPHGGGMMDAFMRGRSIHGKVAGHGHKHSHHSSHSSHHHSHGNKGRRHHHHHHGGHHHHHVPFFSSVNIIPSGGGIGRHEDWWFFVFFVLILITFCIIMYNLDEHEHIHDEYEYYDEFYKKGLKKE